MIIIYVYQLLVLQAKRSLPKSSFVCFFVKFSGSMLRLSLTVVRTIASRSKSSLISFVAHKLLIELTKPNLGNFHFDSPLKAMRAVVVIMYAINVNNQALCDLVVFAIAR